MNKTLEFQKEVEERITNNGKDTKLKETAQNWLKEV
jgi:hypothetical protein